MKFKISIFSLVAIMIFGLCSCPKKEIRINTEESFYSDFEVKDEKVLIYCTLLVENPTKTEVEVEFSANFDNEVELGLLKESGLDGYMADLEKKNIQNKQGR